MTNYSDYITIEPGKRSGKACVRGLRITAQDVLSYLAAGMSQDEIISDFPELTQNDIYACLTMPMLPLTDFYWFSGIRRS